MTLTAPGSLNVLVLAGSQSQPLSQEQAKPMIERYLDNAKKREVAEAELKKLRDAAKVEYLGDYVNAGKQAASGKDALPDADGAAKAVGEMK